MISKKNIIKVSKRLDASNVVEFKTDAMGALKKDPKGIIIDFCDTTFLDSAGLGALVSILKTASQANNKKIALASLSKQVRQIFELTKLYRLFDIYDSVEEAESNI
jgi:anti-sigma B factor antagonist